VHKTRFIGVQGKQLQTIGKNKPSHQAPAARSWIMALAR
jgi:hypothetical protein